MDYFTHATAVIDEGCTIESGVKIWHFAHIMPDAIIGANSNLGQNVFVAAKVKIGKNNKIQNNVSLYEGVITEDDVFIGPSAVFTNVINPRSAVSRKHEYKKTLVQTGATIGANATIVCGIEIGKYAFIGAGAVVTKDVQDFQLVKGNPAKPDGWMSRHGHKLTFENGEAICPDCNEKYILQGGICKLAE
ncbi:MAG: N-acetyltransferase [Saprospiraceae bacterium]|nr:N-acetyltransferase [Saprospiraceae bacterium]